MTYFDGAYAYAKSCTGKTQTGTTGAAAWYKEAYQSKGKEVTTGLYNCRSTVGGSDTSLHGEGRAIDMMIPIGAAWAQKLANALVNMSKELGIQLVIYNKRIWIGGPSQGKEGWQNYMTSAGKNPHTDHLHVELSWDAARKPAEEMKKHWTTVLASASTDEPTSTQNGKGEGLDSGSSSTTKSDSAVNIEKAGDGVPVEESLKGMDNYAKELELRKSLDATAPAEKSYEDLSLEEQKKISALGSNVKPQGKSASDYLALGVSGLGVGMLLYSILLFAFFLFDKSNTIIEGSTLKKASFGKLAVAYDKEDQGKQSGVTYIGWGGLIKYLAIGIGLGLLLISGAFFGFFEWLYNTFNGISA